MAFKIKVFVLLLAVGIAIYGSYEKPGVDASSDPNGAKKSSSDSDWERLDNDEWLCQNCGKWNEDKDKVCQNEECKTARSVVPTATPSKPVTQPPVNQPPSRGAGAHGAYSLTNAPMAYRNKHAETGGASGYSSPSTPPAGGRNSGANKNSRATPSRGITGQRSRRSEASASSSDWENPGNKADTWDHFSFSVWWPPAYYAQNIEWPAMQSWHACPDLFTWKYKGAKVNPTDPDNSFAPRFDPNNPAGCTFPGNPPIPCWPPPYYVVHGLWRETSKSKVAFDKNRRYGTPGKKDPIWKRREDTGLDQAEFERLKVIMPHFEEFPFNALDTLQYNFFLYSHEWHKHGDWTAQLNNTLRGRPAYFRKIIELYDRFKISNLFHRINGEFPRIDGRDLQWGSNSHYNDIMHGLPQYFRALGVTITEGQFAINCGHGSADYQTLKELPKHQIKKNRDKGDLFDLESKPVIHELIICLATDLITPTLCHKSLLEKYRKKCCDRENLKNPYKGILIPVSNHRPDAHRRLGDNGFPVFSKKEFAVCRGTEADFQSEATSMGNWNQYPNLWWNYTGT